MTAVTILPPTASIAERQIDAMLARRAAGINVAILKTLYNAAVVPSSHLAPLGFALSVDQWRRDWSDLQKRNALGNALRLHAIKGTNAAVLGGLNDIGVSAEIIDWFDDRAAAVWDNSLRDGDGAPAPFTAQISIDGVIGGAGMAEINAVIAANKRQSVLMVAALRPINGATDIGVAVGGFAETIIKQFIVIPVITASAPLSSGMGSVIGRAEAVTSS